MYRGVRVRACMPVRVGARVRLRVCKCEQVILKLTGILASGPIAFLVRLISRTREQRVTSGETFF